MLRVRFAEVSRSALQELGASASSPNGYKNDWFGRTTTQQFAAPDFDADKPGGLTFSDFLNLFLFNTKHGLGAVVKALQSKGLFQSLAEPNLIAHQRQGSQLPRRRRVSLSGRAVRQRQQRRHDHVQGVRRPAAASRRRCSAAT